MSVNECLWRIAAGLAASAGCSPPVQADAAWPDKDSVEHILRLETAAVLQAMQGGPGRLGMPIAGAPTQASGVPGPQTDKQDDRISLAAVYGVGKRLQVELLVNGRRQRYQSNRRLPEGVQTRQQQAYRLVAIEGRCVKVDKGEGTRRVCLGPEAQARGGPHDD
jgi:hypothetical protein